CGWADRFGTSDPAAAPATKTPPEWITVECSLETEEVVPGHAGRAGGSMFATLTFATGVLRWRVNYARMTGPATLAGFYGPAAPGRNGPLVVQLPPHSQADQHGTGPDAGHELNGTHTLTPAQVADVVAGLWYLSVSTRTWPAGEVRGQIRRTAARVHGV
ncbi:MAG: CHRD domain-containing protein, partial [Comamonadaceae bacterium]